MNYLAESGDGANKTAIKGLCQAMVLRLKGDLMLDQLDQVEWATLQDSTGPADRVPDCIRSLTSPDVGDWAPAVQELWDRIDQGAIYEATPKAIRFLAEVAAHPIAASRARVLELIGDIASSVNYWSATYDLPPARLAPSDLRHMRQLAGEAAAEIAAHLNVAIEAMADINPTVRVSSSYCIGRFGPRIAGTPETAGRAITGLTILLANDHDALVRASAAFALGTCISFSPPAKEVLVQIIASVAPQAVRLSAAMALCGGAHDLPHEAVTELTIALAEGDRVDRLFQRPATTEIDEWQASAIATAYEAAGMGAPAIGRAFPWFTWRPYRHVIASVCTTGRELLPKFAAHLAAVIRESKQHDFSAECEPVLRYAFPTRLGGPDEITPPQLELLDALFENSGIWVRRDAYMDSLLKSRGLPTSQYEWSIVAANLHRRSSPSS